MKIYSKVDASFNDFIRTEAKRDVHGPGAGEYTRDRLKKSKEPASPAPNIFIKYSNGGTHV